MTAKRKVTIRTNDEKLEIIKRIDEAKANGTSLEAAAKAEGVYPTQIGVWKKQLGMVTNDKKAKKAKYQKLSFTPDAPKAGFEVKGSPTEIAEFMFELSKRFGGGVNG